jgi:hypothetical protein
MSGPEGAEEMKAVSLGEDIADEDDTGDIV